MYNTIRQNVPLYDYEERSGMIVDITYYPDPILQKTTKKVPQINGEIEKLVRDMLETMYSKNGLGLAAPQVGVSKRICVIDIS